MSELKYRVAAMTHTGKVRDHNEDNFILNPDLSKGDWVFDSQLEYTPSDSGAIWVVADGMGGTNAGEVASELAVQSVKKDFANAEKLAEGIKNPKKFLRKAILDMNDRMLQHAEENPQTQDMGTTVVLAWLLGDQLHISWIGDSRAYLFRNGKLQPISKDHSLVQQMVDAGKLTDEQAFYHPENNIITQSLGGETKKLDPGYQNLELYNDDVVLLCTDGLNGMLLDHRIEELLQNPGDCSQRANLLLEAALEEGAHDNVTLVLARVIGGKKLPAHLAATVSTVEGSQEQPARTPDTPEPKDVVQKRPKKSLVKKLIGIILILLAFGLGMAVMYFAVNSKNEGEKVEEVKDDQSEGGKAEDDKNQKENIPTENSSNGDGVSGKVKENNQENKTKTKESRGDENTSLNANKENPTDRSAGAAITPNPKTDSDTAKAQQEGENGKAAENEVKENEEKDSSQNAEAKPEESKNTDDVEGDNNNEVNDETDTDEEKTQKNK